MFKLYNMNQKGGTLLIMIIIFILVIVIIPIFLFNLYTISKPILQIILAFAIIGYVKNMGVDGILMWIISGILIYFICAQFKLYI